MADNGSIFAKTADLALRDARHPHGLDQIIDRPGGNALNIGFLNDRSQGLLGHAPGLQKAREVGTRPQLRDAQFDGSGPGLPVPIPVAIALRQAGRVLLAKASTSRSPHLQLHQPFGGKADHLAQQVSVWALLNKRPQVHHLVGHRWSLRFRVGVSN